MHSAYIRLNVNRSGVRCLYNTLTDICSFLTSLYQLSIQYSGSLELTNHNYFFFFYLNRTDKKYFFALKFQILAFKTYLVTPKFQIGFQEHSLNWNTGNSVCMVDVIMLLYMFYIYCKYMRKYFPWVPYSLYPSEIIYTLNFTLLIQIQIIISNYSLLFKNIFALIWLMLFVSK